MNNTKDVNDIIQGIARKSAYKFSPKGEYDKKTEEELVQELWVTVLEKEEQKGHELDPDLIAKICYDKITDMQRYNARRNHYSIDQMIETSEDGEDNDFTVSHDQSTEKQVEENDRIQGLLNHFEEGSREKLFIEYWLSSTGFYDLVKGEGKQNGGYTESDLASKLGYAGTASGGYKKFRNKMRNFIREYFDLNED